MSENMKVDRDSISLLVMLAEDFYDNDAFVESINYCNMILAQFPDIKDAQIILLKSYKKMNDENSFNELYSNLIKKYPDDSQLISMFQKASSPAPSIAEEPKSEQVKSSESKPPVLQNRNIESNVVLSADETETLLDKALGEINSINGVLGSIIIEESGLIIRSKVIENLDSEITAALFSTIFYVAEDSIQRIELGMIDRVFIEVGKVRIYLFKGNGYILGIFTEEIVKIGLILIKAKQLLKNIKQVLE